MTRLNKSIGHWDTETFNQILAEEICQLPSGSLPLHLGTTQGGIVDDSNLEITVLSTSATESSINVKAGVFFTEIVICCGCGDDPMPVNAYCELHINIDKLSAHAQFQVIQV